MRHTPLSRMAHMTAMGPRSGQHVSQCSQQTGAGTGGGVQAGGSPWAPGPAGGGLSLGALMVQLDQRFLTQLAHTAAHFAALFPGAPRKQLLKVRTAKCRRRPYS